MYLRASWWNYVFQLPCTVATPTCGDTCGKTLACGTHVCVDRCHRGTCGSCLQVNRGALILNLVQSS